MTATFQRPALELADVVRRHGHRLGEQLGGEQRRILRAIASCRTAILGGHVEHCAHCQYRRIAYNSCRNRHCPRCQGSACAQWMEDRAQELLPVEYFHVVFTLPDAFNALALANRRIVYGVLFDAVARTLLEVAANPRHLGARIGFIAILHTWGQNLCLHPHIHCVVPGGGLSADGSRWIACKKGFFLPVRVLSKVFRGKFIDLLKRARDTARLAGAADGPGFTRLLNDSVKQDWVVYAKPPFGGPGQVLKYLSRYTHRIAISNRRLVSMDDQSVTFKWKDYAHGNRPRTMTLDGAQFLRRFLLHAVPRGFMRIRHFGFLANRCRSQNLAACRRLLNVSCENDNVSYETDPAPPPAATGTVIANPACCPACQRGRLVPGPYLSPFELSRLTIRLDSS
jgi:hypothetical protein